MGIFGYILWFFASQMVSVYCWSWENCLLAYYKVFDITSYDDSLRGLSTRLQLATVTRRLTRRVAAATLEMMCCCCGDPMLSS